MQPLDEQPEQQPEPTPALEVPETGVPAVDEVLGSLPGLEDSPVSEHVAVFEQAHQRLRRVLDGGADPAGQTGQGG